MYDKNIYSILEWNDLLNTTDSSCCRFYDPAINNCVILSLETGDIDYYEDYEKENETTVYALPYKEECEDFAKRNFTKYLSDEERDIVNRYDGNGGFFAYLKETGIIERFIDAKGIAADYVIRSIERKCNRSIDVAGLTI